MSAPRADLSFVVFYDSHSADAIYTLGMPQGEQRVVGLLAFALCNFMGDVVIHLFFSFSFCCMR